ncbi:MAG TPA: nucleotidyltransferase domain-containing protein [Treponemataceae bacterium]|nr:nucleotidyltransferase domain-containing protein [Treponemataceae bacterium]
MTEEQQKQIAEITERHRKDKNVVAVILIGSIARGDAREGSDVDYNLVVKERRELCDVTKDDLKFTIAHGNELTRWSYTSAKVLYSTDDEIEGLIKQIPVYPENRRQYNMESFVSQIKMHFAYLQLAEYSKNTYLLHETAAKIALFSGRLILADNRVLYPNRKWYSREIQRIEDKPKDFYEKMRELLNAPTIDKARTFIDGLMAYKAYPEPAEGWVNRFNKDSVLSWKNGTFSIEDW